MIDDDTDKTGGPAFPGPYVDSDGSLEALWKQEGMSLRDYFAAKALQGLLASPNLTVQFDDALAQAAYKLSDAMLEARKIDET